MGLNKGITKTYFNIFLFRMRERNLSYLWTNLPIKYFVLTILTIGSWQARIQVGKCTRQSSVARKQGAGVYTGNKAPQHHLFLSTNPLLLFYFPKIRLPFHILSQSLHLLTFALYYFPSLDLCCIWWIYWMRIESLKPPALLNFELGFVYWLAYTIAYLMQFLNFRERRFCQRTELNRNPPDYSLNGVL